jgi:nucleoside-diphosphate-sugar epimerase
MRQPERDMALNAVAHLRFLQTCRRVRPGIRVVYAGTRQVYGRPEYLPVNEVHRLQAVDFNAIHKLAGAQYHLLLSSRGEIDAAVLRLTNVYGPRMALRLPWQGFLGCFFRSVLEGEPLRVYGDGMQLRDPLYVDDAVRAFLMAGAAERLPSRIYNVGGPEALPLSRIAELMSGASPACVPFPDGRMRSISGAIGLTGRAFAGNSVGSLPCPSPRERFEPWNTTGAGWDTTSTQSPPRVRSEQATPSRPRLPPRDESPGIRNPGPRGKRAVVVPRDAENSLRPA